MSAYKPMKSSAISAPIIISSSLARRLLSLGPAMHNLRQRLLEEFETFGGDVLQGAKADFSIHHMNPGPALEHLGQPLVRGGQGLLFAPGAGRRLLCC